MKYQIELKEEKFIRELGSEFRVRKVRIGKKKGHEQ
jgi:hypothetical protein